MKTPALARLPFLQGVPPVTIKAVNRALRPMSVTAGTVLFRTGEHGDACYLVESGALRVSITPDGEVLATLGPGSFVGELALLLDEPRSATVVAVTDSALLELTRSQLDALILDHPDLALAITRELGRRIVHANKRLTGGFAARRCVVWPAAMAGRLADAITSPRRSVAVAALPGAKVGAVSRQVLRVRGTAFSATTASVATVLIAAPETAPSSTAQRSVAIADHVLAFGSPPDWLIAAASPNRLVRLPETTLGVRRAVRWATGQSVGVALSSGGSKTIAHLGVLRVLADAGIEIDAVAGSSGGSIGAVGVAFSAGEPFLRRAINDLARATNWRHLDFNVPPRTALSKGRRLRDLFTKWHVGANLEDALIPVWLVAADLATGDPVVINRGSTADAIRGSLSVPGVFDPWRVGGRLVIDGAVANPLPTDVLRDAGVGIVIASNVAGQATVVEVGGRLPGLPQVLGRMLNTMERERLNSLLPLADVVIRPRVTTGNTFDFRTIESTITAGVAAATERLDDIQRILTVASDFGSASD